METKNNKEISGMWISIITAIVFTLVLFAGTFIIEYLLSTENDISTLDCIAEKSELYVSDGCGYCNKQKQLLGEDLAKFNIIDCRENLQACIDNNIEVVPTWIIDNETYKGYHMIEDLKEATGC